MIDMIASYKEKLTNFHPFHKLFSPPKDFISII